MSKPNAAQKLAAELTVLAKAATPGPWVTDGDYVNEHGNVLQSYIASGRKLGGRIASAFANCLVKTGEQCQANAAFIAGANPKAVLALVADLDTMTCAAQALRDEWRKDQAEVTRLKAECDGLRARSVIDKEAARWRMRELLPGVPGDMIDHALLAVINEAKAK